MSRWYFLIAVCALPAVVFGFQAKVGQSPADLLAEAIALHQRGDIEAAITDYTAYLAIRPDAFEALSNLGAALAHVGRFDQAIAEYRHALALHPENPSVIMNLGLAYYKTGHFTEAAAQWSVAHQMQPANRQITMLLADAEFRIGNYINVVALLGPSSELDAPDLGAAYLLGTALIAAHKTQEAQALAERVLQNGDSAQVRILLGTLELERGDSAAAATDLERATAMDPHLPGVFSSYGAALLSMGESERAEAAFRRELENDPNDFLTHLSLGFLLKQDDRYAEALMHLQRALELRPADIAARYQVASLHLFSGDLKDAVTELESIVGESPQFVAARVSLTTAYYRLNRKGDGDRERAAVQELNIEAQTNFGAISTP